MKYQVRNHLLSGERVNFIESPNRGAIFNTGLPDSLIMHYTAGPSLTSAVNWFKRTDAKASAHLVIDRNGAVVQMVPFNMQAWHAGESGFNGRTGYNRYSIGIELVNAGLLTPLGEQFIDVYGYKYPASDVLEAAHKNGGRKQHWQAFTPAQLETAIEISRQLKNTYGLKFVLGHDDISPRRKVDPGPAFPMEVFRMRIFEELDKDEPDPSTVGLNGKTGIVNTEGLNIREEPSVQSGKVALPLRKGTTLEILEKSGDWYFVKTEISGWVAKAYVDING